MAPSRKKGANKATAATELRLGDLVLAKVKGFPAWPAKVSRPEDWKRVPDPRKYFVQFFGTQEIAFVAPPDVQAFTCELKSKLVTRCKGKTVKYFAQAVKEICEAFEELEKSDWSGTGDDATSSGHNASNVEERNANGSCTELSRRPKSEELCGRKSELDHVSGLGCFSSMESLLQRVEVKKSSDCNGMLEKVKENVAGRDLRTEALIRSSIVSSSVKKEEAALFEIKADTDAHRERIHSSRASSSSPYSSHSKVKRVTSHHGDGKKVNPMLLGASVNLKSFSVGDKKSANGHRSLESIAGSKRKIDGLIRHTDDANSGVFIKDQIPQKLSDREHVKRLSAGVNRLEPDPCWRVVQCLPRIPKLSGVRKSTPHDAVVGSKECGEREYSRQKDRQPDLEQLQLIKKAKLEHSISDVVKGSTINIEKGDVEPKIHEEEAVPSVRKCQRQANEALTDVNVASDRRSFGLRTLKSDIPKRRRAVCLYNDDDEPKTPVHGGSSTSIVSSPAIILDSLKNNENHDTSSWGESTKVSIRDATGSQNESQLNMDNSTKAQESHNPEKEELNKQLVKEGTMDLLSPAKSPVVAAAKRLVDKQKPNRLPHAKDAILHSCSKAQNVPGNDFKSISIVSKSTQKSRVPLLGEKAKGTPKASSRLNGAASSLDNQMDRDSALGDGRLEDAKDKSDTLVDSKALDSAMSMKHLIAAAQAKRRQALSQTASQGNENSVSAPITNVHGKSPSPVYMPHDSSSGMGNVEHDSQEVNLHGSFPSPHVQIRQLDPEEPEDKVPGSGHQGAGSTLSGGTEAAVARDAFEGMIETLSRTKESIGRATRLAIDCAKHGIANEVVELLIRKLENEAIIHRRVDLFFLVDSITQCSHSQKGVAGASYIPVIQGALPRLLGPAAPSGTSARENRRQCLKVLRLWLERRIFPESVLRRFMDDIGSSHDDLSSGISFRRLSRAERSVDDPIREMEGMLVDEYGSNATFNLPGFLSTHGFVDDDDGDEEDVPSISLKETDASPLQCSNNSGGLETGIGTPNDRHHHILEEVDGELEMEDVSGHLKDGTLSPCRLSKKDTPEMLLNGQLESSINDVAESPLMECSPPLPPESPPPFPPLPTSPPPPPPPSSPSPPPPPPPMLPSQLLPSSLVSSGPPQVGNLQPLLLPQPSISPQVFLRPPSAVPSVQASPVGYCVSTGTHPVQIACSTPQVPYFPNGPSASLDTPGYRLVYGGPQAGQSNHQFQQSQQFQSCQATFTPRAFPPVKLPQPPSGHFSYNKPTVQSQMPQPRQHPPPAALSHPYSAASHSEGLRRVGDEQWRSASAEHKADNQHNSWANGGKMTSCPPANFIGEAYFRPTEITPADSMGYQASAPNPSMPGHGVNQMLPPRPDMLSLNYWRPA